MATKTKDEKQDATSETAVAAGKLQPAVPSMAELADMEAKRDHTGGQSPCAMSRTLGQSPTAKTSAL